MHPFTLVFITALVISISLKTWLAARQLHYVRAHRAAVPVVFKSKVRLDAHQKAADYTIAKIRLGLAQVTLETVVLLALTLGGGIRFIAERWHGTLSTPLLDGTAFIVSVVLLLGALEIPFSIYRAFVIETRFGFNKMTLPLFFADLAKQTLLGALFGIPLIIAVLWLIARMGPAWWLYTWLLWIGFNLLVLAVYPTIIAPLFNKFEPLTDKPLQERIDKLLKKCRFQAQGLYVMDGSRRSNHGNAYFTGFGKSRRIVFFDNLLKQLNHDEVEAVLAHELGHYKRGHIYQRLGLLFFISFLFLWLLGKLSTQPWFYLGLHAGAPSTEIALVLFLLVIPIFLFPFEPLFSLYSRKHEFEADRFAAQNADASALRSALLKLYRDNATTLTPDPLYSAVYDSHPSAPQRLARLQQLTTDNTSAD